MGDDELTGILRAFRAVQSDVIRFRGRLEHLIAEVAALRSLLPPEQQAEAERRTAALYERGKRDADDAEQRLRLSQKPASDDPHEH